MTDQQFATIVELLKKIADNTESIMDKVSGIEIGNQVITDFIGPISMDDIESAIINVKDAVVEVKGAVENNG